MKRLLSLLLLLLPFILSAEGYYFTHYQISMTVHSDNTYSVTEDMDINFTESRHGIYRTIPIKDVWVMRDTTVAQDRSGSVRHAYQVRIEDIRANVGCSPRSVDGCMDIRLGDSDRLLSGPQHIQLSYTMCVPDDRISVADLFFYSLMGTENPCPTELCSFSIRFDQPVPDAYLSKLEVFSGRLGSNTNQSEQIITQRSPQLIEGRIENLAAHEALTIYLPLPEGYFQVTTPWQSYAALILILLAAAVLIYVIYHEFVRDEHVASVVSFYPPKDFSSAEVGTLIDCEVDDQDLISLIPWFANNGYLRIEQEKGNTTLTKVKDLPDDAPRYQKSFFNGLFASGKTFSTGRPSSRAFGKHWLSAKEQLEHDYRYKLNDLDWGMFKWLSIGICLTGVALAFASAVSGSTVFAILITLLYFVTAFITFSFYADKTRKASAPVTVACLAGIFAIFSGFAPSFFLELVCSIIYEFISIDLRGIDYVSMARDLYVPQFLFAGLILLCFFACAMSLRLGVITKYRRENLPEILGLKDFIDAAEKDRLQMLLDQDEQYFYKVLPFAVAFGMADRWADKFKDLSLQPNEAYPVSNTLYDYARFNSVFNNDNVRHGIKAEENARAEAAARASSRSGSSWGSSGSFGGGGGGYSGGGFGGGGSRSW